MEIKSFNKFVFILAMAAARCLEVESKLGILAIFNLHWTVNVLGRNHQLGESCGFTTRNDSHKFFYLVHVVVCSLAGNFQLPGNRREVWNATPLTQHIQMRTLCPHITLHSFLEPHLWLKVILIVSKIIVSFHLSRDVSCSAQNTEHFILYFFLCSRSPKVAHIQNFMLPPTPVSREEEREFGFGEGSNPLSSSKNLKLVWGLGRVVTSPQTPN